VIFRLFIFLFALIFFVILYQILEILDARGNRLEFVVICV